MRILKLSTLDAYWQKHAGAEVALRRWYERVSEANWACMDGVQQSFATVKVLNAERARFEIAGGHHRMVVAFDFRRQIVYVKFLGTHAEYDRIDALTVSQF
jgi:mRNA interferase HigB